MHRTCILVSSQGDGNLIKRTVGILLTIILLLLLFWFGENGKGIFQHWPYLIAIAGCFIVSYLGFNRIIYRILTAPVFLVLFLLAFHLGSNSFYNAFNECLNKAEDVRIVLSNYKNKHGEYPEKLKDLNVKIPGLRIMRGSLLQYERTNSGYKISFEDWLIERSATEASPFTARK
jgi:hypothetical protein